MLVSNVHLSVEGGVAIAQQRTREHELRLVGLGLLGSPLLLHRCLVQLHLLGVSVGRDAAQCVVHALTQVGDV